MEPFYFYYFLNQIVDTESCSYYNDEDPETYTKGEDKVSLIYSLVDLCCGILFMIISCCCGVSIHVFVPFGHLSHSHLSLTVNNDTDC